MPPDPRLREFARGMRREPTPAEEAVWRVVRNRRLAGFKFRRQHPLGLYILDFYSRSCGLVVELDGDSHATEEGKRHDEVRTRYLEALGPAVIRFWNTEVHESPDAVAEVIAAACERRSGVGRRRTPPEDRQPRNRKKPGGEKFGDEP